MSYDPIRRKSFMKPFFPPADGQIHFALGMLPKEFKQPVIDASRVLNAVKGQRDAVSNHEFRQLMAEIRSMVEGHRFSFEVSGRIDGKLKVQRKTICRLE